MQSIQIIETLSDYIAAIYLKYASKTKRVCVVFKLRPSVHFCLVQT